VKNRLDGSGQDKGLALLGLESTHIFGVKLQIVGTGSGNIFLALA
jgi:hypothetical protein